MVWRVKVLRSRQTPLLVSSCLLTWLCLDIYTGYSLQEPSLSPPDWAARAAAVSSICSSSPSRGAVSRDPPPIVRISSLGLDWCLVPKVASSSICRAILPFLPATKHKQELYPFIQKEVWTRAGQLSWASLTSSPLSSLLLTRHPLARVASAFRNKLEDRKKSFDGEYFYRTYSSQIIRHGRGSWSPDSPEPTFEEFVSWLLHEPVEKYDEHWLPVSLRCSVCQLPYTYIVRYENITAEWQHLLSSLNLTSGQKAALQLPWENRGQGRGLKHYYSSLPAKHLEQLYYKMQDDFLMFGYSMEDDF